MGVAATPIQTMAAGPLQGKGPGANRAGVVSILSGGNIVSSNHNSLKDFLENCQSGNVQIITIPCLPGNQQWPGTDNNNQNSQPGAGDNNQNGQPGTGDNNQPNNPDTEDSEQSVHAYMKRIVELVMEAWMNSLGHRANILNEKYTSIGVGYYQNAAGRNYWSQLFTY